MPPKPSTAAEQSTASSSHAAAADSLAGVQPPFTTYGAAAASHLAPPVAFMGLAASASGVSGIGSAAPPGQPPAPPVAPELLAHLRRYSGQPNAPAAQAAFDWLVAAHAAPATCWEQVLTSARVLLAAASWAGVPAERLSGASEAELSQMLRAYVTRVVAGPTAVDASAAGATAEATHAEAGAAAMPAGAAAAVGRVDGATSLEAETGRRGLGAKGALNSSSSYARRGARSSSGAGAARATALQDRIPASSSSYRFAGSPGAGPGNASGVGADSRALARSAGNADGDVIAAALAAGVQSRGSAAPQAMGSAAGFRTPASTVRAERRSDLALSLPTAAAAGGTSLFAASAHPPVAPMDPGSSLADGAVVGRKRSRRAAAAAAGADADSAETASALAGEDGTSGDPAQLSGISLNVPIGPPPDSSSGGSAGAQERQPRGRQRRAPDRYSDRSSISGSKARRRNSGSTTCSTATSPGGSARRGPQQDCFSLGLFAPEAAVGEARSAGGHEYVAHAVARTTVRDSAASGGAPNTADARSPAALAPYSRLSLRSARLARNAPSAASPAADNGGAGSGAGASSLSLSMPVGAGGDGCVVSGPAKRRRTSSASRGASRHTGAS
jgi:hypothetical protein